MAPFSALSVSRVTCRAVSGGVQHPGDAVRWAVTFVLDNAGPSSLELTDAWIPHDKFRGEGRSPLSIQIAPGATHALQCAVTADEPPGTIVENAFLILRVFVDGVPWRVFIRLRIEFDSSAVPVPMVEAITTQSLK